MKEIVIHMRVEIKKKKKKAIFFDFDNTLADWDLADQYVNKQIATYVRKTFGVEEHLFLAQMDLVKHGVKGKLFNDTYDRFAWFKKIFSYFHISITEKQLRVLHDIYWK